MLRFTVRIDSLWEKGVRDRQLNARGDEGGDVSTPIHEFRESLGEDACTKP
jgi:hypothetical protein